MLLTLTRDDVFRAAVEGCQPSTVAIERMFDENGMVAHAVQLNPSVSLVWLLSSVLRLYMPLELARFNAAYLTGDIITLDQSISQEITLGR